MLHTEVMKRDSPPQDVPSAGLLDVTNNKTLLWLGRQMRNLVETLGGGNGKEVNTAFYVDSGNAFHTPTYFQVCMPSAVEMPRLK